MVGVPAPDSKLALRSRFWVHVVDGSEGLVGSSGAGCPWVDVIGVEVLKFGPGGGCPADCWWPKSGLGLSLVTGSAGPGDATGAAPDGPLLTTAMGPVGGGPPTCGDAARAPCGPNDASKVEPAQKK